MDARRPLRRSDMLTSQQCWSKPLLSAVRNRTPRLASSIHCTVLRQNGARCLRQARVDDGLDAVAEAAEAVRSGAAPPLDALVVDASSGDASQVSFAASCAQLRCAKRSCLGAQSHIRMPGLRRLKALSSMAADVCLHDLMPALRC